MPPSPDQESDPLEASAYERVRADPGLRLMLETARAWGVSPARFMGWEPGPGEPEWDDESRQLAVALQQFEALLCSGCGWPMDETTTADAEDRFVPAEPIRCHRCTALSQARSIHTTEYHPHAVIYSARDRWTTGATGGTEDGEDEPADDPAED